MARDGAVLLLGNGLSIAVNENLRLDRLTATFLERRGDERELIERLAAGVSLGAVDPATDFEGIVAGIESAEEVIAAFIRLAHVAARPEFQEAAAVLESQGVPALVRRLYYEYCADVLDAIGESARVADIPEPVMQFGKWVKAQHARHGRLSIFTLNYDVLMERMLIGSDLLDLREHTTDFFGPPRTAVEIAEGVGPIEGYAFHGQPSHRTVQLHHLHGCLTHLRAPDGTIYKFSAGKLRRAQLYTKLADGARSDFVPSVILGSKKAERALEWPFSHAFGALEEEVAAARTVCIAGYSFRDEAVNERLRSRLAGVERLIVLDHAPDDARWEAFRPRVETALGTSDVEWYRDGFGGGPPAEL
jgi:SIR2-like domain